METVFLLCLYENSTDKYDNTEELVNKEGFVRLIDNYILD